MAGTFQRITLHTVNGGCHCRNIQVEVDFTQPPAALHPRACDCDFCRKHGAAWLSDANGSLRIRIDNARERGTYRQGSRQAELVLCRSCGVLVAALLRTAGHLYGAVNVKAVEGTAGFGAEQTVSPHELSAGEKANRWQGIWFSNVQIVGDAELSGSAGATTAAR